MRLLLASFYYPPSLGGVERQSYLLARGMADRGHSVRVISASFGGAPQRERSGRLAVDRISLAGGARVAPTLRYITGMLWIMHRLRQCTDVVHVQQVLYPAMAAAAYASFWQLPLVVANHGSGPSGGVRVMQQAPFGSRGLDLISSTATTVALNNEMRDEMRHVGFARIVKIPNGVPIPTERSTERRAAARGRLGLSGRVVLYMGRLSWEKGIDVLADAWSCASLRDATLLVVGDGPLRRALARPNTGSKASRIEIRGPTTNVQTYLDAADAFVLPSRGEGLSYSLLEAMATGLPVIATSVGGNREVIVAPEFGMLVPPEDASALAYALTEVIADADLRARLGRSGRQHVQLHYSVEAMVDAYERLYLNVSGGRS